MDTSVLVMASVGAAIMAAALVYQSLLAGNGASLRWWGGAIFLLLTHLIVERVLLLSGASHAIASLVGETMHLAGGMLLYGGSRLFCGLPPRKLVLSGVVVVGVMWLGVSTILGLPNELVIFPTHLLVGGSMVLVATGLMRSGGLSLAHSAYLASALCGWCLSLILFPILMVQPGFAGTIDSFDLMSSQAFGTLVALGMLVIAMRRQSDRIDQSRRQALASEQVAAEQAEQIRHILDVMPDVVISVGAGGIIEQFNPSAEAVFGYRSEQVLGKPLALLMPDLELDAQMIQAASAHPKGEAIARVSSSETIGHRRDGARVVLAVTVSASEQQTGPLFVVVARDISESRLSGRLGEFLHRLDQKALRALGAEDFGQEVCADLAEIFEIPLVMLIDRNESDGMDLRAVKGAVHSSEVEQRLSAFVRTGGAPCAPLLEVIRTGGDLLAHRDSRNARLLQACGDDMEWALILPLWVQNDVASMLVAIGDDLAPDEPTQRRLETAVARLGAVQQQVLDQQRLRLQSTAMAAAANAIFITDRDGHIEWVNEAFTRLSGYPAEEVIGKTPAFLKSGAQDPETYQRLWETITDGSVWRGEMVERRQDGTLYTVDQTVAPILDESGTIAHFVAIHEDVTERKRAEERILYLSNYDTLTRLPNRVLFRDHLYQAVSKARTDHSALAVMFIDLDRFSRVNDTLGHEVGDQLLMTVASRINAVAAPFSETVARIGGDEFAIIQSNLSNAETAATLARKIIEEVAKPVDLDGIDVRVGANVGIAIFPQDGEDPDHMIKNADMAMYRAIRSETESYCFFSNDMNAEARIRLSLEGDLRRALDNGDLTLYFQPQVNVKTRKLMGVEALLRWTHPEQGPISPARFIPVAEDSGLILPIGDWVLQEAMRQRQAWTDMNLPPVTMAINISAVQFRQQDLVARVRHIAEQTGVDPRQIELELTESMLMQDAREAVAVLSSLSEMGAQLAIDDFGTGYSSLSYLKQFPVDKLKLDQSFVRHMTSDHNDAVIAHATINLGHSLGLEVIAEGVETEDQYAYLLAEGCDVIQGYLFGRPVPASGIEDLLTRQATSETGDAFPHIPIPDLSTYKPLLGG
jgi:diguanylate cyclase (GGDEF)-like protein/PAS domain S-box-containing protein